MLRIGSVHFSAKSFAETKAELSMGWVDPRVGLGRVEYDKSTIFFDDHTTYNCKVP